MFGRRTFRISNAENDIEKLREALNQAEAVIIGAGAGLSTSAGFTYAGNALKPISVTLPPSIPFVIYIPVDFILLTVWKNFGAGGAGTYGSIVI